ncbi:hypothetical protein [Streptomyces sp. NPDC058254]|uniref:hypothetical protein n=1 Tax=Streptomyces sp. NPDC058254 TaxID=3346406 RepID=UPI0036E6E0B1
MSTAPEATPLVDSALIVSAVSTAWCEIQRRHPDVPRIAVTVPPSGTRFSPAKCATLRTGQHFVRAGAITMELQVSAASVAHGGRAMMQGLLHHAAHGLALCHGIRDTNSAGRWHNQRFVNFAAELGLTPPLQASAVIGKADCDLTDETAALWQEVISALDGAAAVQLEATIGSASPPRTPRAGVRFAIVCECRPPRRTQVTHAFMEQGPVLCGVCLARFKEQIAPQGA